MAYTRTEFDRDVARAHRDYTGRMRRTAQHVSGAVVNGRIEPKAVMSIVMIGWQFLWHLGRVLFYGVRLATGK